MARRSYHLNPQREKSLGYAQAVRRGDYLHISGSLSLDDDFTPLYAGDMEAQVVRVYDVLRRTLRLFDMGFPNVVSERIYVTDMDAFMAANGTRLAIYRDTELPAVSVMEVRRLLHPECMIEVEVVAAR